MSIEINGLNPGRQESLRRDEKLESQSKPSSAPSSEASAASAAPKQGESVSLSSTAQNLSQLEASLKQAPEVNAEKVEEIRAQIESGQYKVDSSNLAQKLLDFDL